MRNYIFLLLLLTSCSESIINQLEQPAQKAEEMGKIINAYGGYTATDIKNRADIPLQVDMVVSGTTVDCTNLQVTQIKNVLGSASTAVGGLCTDPLVNKWSGFSPREWYIDAGVLLNRVKVPYTLGSFAGYNHNATAPGYFNVATPTEFYFAPTSTQEPLIGPVLYLGEIDWLKASGVGFVKWTIKRLGVLIASSSTPIANARGYICPTIDVPTSNFSLASTDLVSELFLSTNGTSSELCIFPNTTAWNITAIKLVAPITTFNFAGLVNNVEGSTGSVDADSNYSISITPFYDAHYVFNGNISIRANVYNENGVLVSYADIVTNSLYRDFSGNIGVSVSWGYTIDFVVTGL